MINKRYGTIVIAINLNIFVLNHDVYLSACFLILSMTQFSKRLHLEVLATENV